MPSVAVAKTRYQIDSNLSEQLRTSRLFDDHRLGLHELGTVESELCPLCKAEREAREAREARKARKAREASKSQLSKRQLSPETKAALEALDNPQFNLTYINKAFRKLALQTHPDKTLDVNDEEFKKINRAHKLLLEKLKQRSGGSKRHIRRKYRKTHRHTKRHRRTHG